VLSNLVTILHYYYPYISRYRNKLSRGKVIRCLLEGKVMSDLGEVAARAPMRNALRAAVYGRHPY